MLNTRFDSLRPQYLFAAIADRVAARQRQDPETGIISLGIGDVSLPLGESVTAALEQAATQMGDPSRFSGYGPVCGKPELRCALSAYFAGLGAEIAPDEIYIGDGAKSDIGNFLSDLLSADCRILLPDPGYPVYADVCRMAGLKPVFLPAARDNGFLPSPAAIPTGFSPQVILLCSPGNPTGAAYDTAGLGEWVDFANRTGALLLLDAAYRAFLPDGYPKSVFALPAAKSCAVEFGSFSKSAGFTGLRCGYTVIPRELRREGRTVGALWQRRQSTKFNGTCCLAQAGALAALSPAGREECRRNLAVYRDNAALIFRTLRHAGMDVTGGETSPYVWMACPGGMASESFFEAALRQEALVCTPGIGFGAGGEGYVRLSGFASPADVREGLVRLTRLLSRL